MADKKIQPANYSPRYRKFTNAAARALEKLHYDAQLELNDMGRQAFSNIVQMIAMQYNKIPKQSLLTTAARQIIGEIDKAIDLDFVNLAIEMSKVIERLSAQAFALSAQAEGEALSQALDASLRVSIPKGSSEAVAGDTFLGDDLQDRLFFILSDIKRKIMRALEQSRVLEENVSEAIARIIKALPPVRRVKKSKPVLKRQVKEADAQPLEKEPVGYRIMDDQEWTKIRDQYTRDYVPKWRGPSTVFDVKIEGIDEEWYGWQVEQLASQEFVDKVRGGQVLAASQNGITDFQWIAIVDDKTDECCVWRDGLTTEEIEQKLRTTHKDDECKSLVPPAHFNCRCTLAPMLKDMPDKPASNAQEFDEWLNS